MEKAKKSLDEILPLLFTRGRDMAGEGNRSSNMDVLRVRIVKDGASYDVVCKFYPHMMLHSPTPKAVESVVIGLPGKRMVIDCHNAENEHVLTRYNLPSDYEGGLERFSNDLYGILMEYKLKSEIEVPK